MSFAWKSSNSVVIFYKISATCCQSLPNILNYRGLRLVYVCYSLLIVLLMTAWHIYLLLKLMNAWESSEAELATLALINTYSMVSTVFVQRRNYVQIYVSLNHMENILSKKFEATCTCRWQKFLIPGLAFCGLIDLMDFLDGLDLQALSKSIQYTMLDLTLIQRCILLRRFEELSKLWMDNFSSSLSYPRKEPYYVRMGFFMQTYEKLCKSLSTIGSFFHVQIGLIYTTILLGFFIKAPGVYQELTEKGQSVSVWKEVVFLLKSLVSFPERFKTYAQVKKCL